MALPAALRQDGAVPQPTGVLIGITPGNASQAIELQRAPDDGTGHANAGAAVTITTLPPSPLSGIKYPDPLSITGVFVFYRWRHIGAGYDPGSWTGFGRAIATTLPSGSNLQSDTGLYPIHRDLPLTDGVYALRASANDGSTNVSDAMNPQGSTPPITADANPFSYSGVCPSSATRGSIAWTWSAFTIYRADGTTISVPASSSLATTAAPTLSQVAGGALAARTRCVRIGLVKDKMLFGVSAETSLAVSVNNLLKVTSPAAVAGYDGWIPLVGSVGTNDEVLQTGAGGALPASPIAFGTDWTEPTTGAIQPTGNNTQMNDYSGVLKAAHDGNLAASTTYQYYPCLDVANVLISFAGGGAMSAKSILQASRQNRDGYIPLAVLGAMPGVTPAVGSPSSGGGGGGCLHPDTLVETARGVRKLGTLAVGDTVRARDGSWTRITRKDTKPCTDWVRVTVAGGESLLATPSHPFTMATGGLKRAHELAVRDLLLVFGGMAEIARLEAVTLSADQVDVECAPVREFWAGESAPTILTHNAFAQS